MSMSKATAEISMICNKWWAKKLSWCSLLFESRGNSSIAEMASGSLLGVGWALDVAEGSALLPVNTSKKYSFSITTW